MLESSRYSLAVLLPCYNEGLSIASVVISFRKVLPGARIYVYDNNSTDDTAQQAALAGATVVTHLFNAMSQMGGRAPGVAGAVMASNRLFAGIIADGHHVDGDTLSGLVLSRQRFAHFNNGDGDFMPQPCRDFGQVSIV